MKNIDKTRIDENIVIRTKQRKFFCIIDGTKMFGHVVTKRFFCQFSCASKFEVLVLEKWSYLELCGIESADKMNSTNKEKPKKVKSVKMSVDFSSMDIEDRIMGSPSISISSPPKDNPPFSLDDDDYINEQYFVESTQNEVNSNLECAFSEVDPKLILAASKFVHELIFQAQIEAQNRLMSSQLDNNIADTDPLLAGKGQKRPKLDSHSSADGNLRFIREEINKKCRRMYRVFLSCYGKLP